MKQSLTPTRMLKDFFFPTDNNEMVPLMLSRQVFMFYVVLGVALVVGPSYLRGRQLALLTTPLAIPPTQVIDLVNQSRAAHGLPALVPNDSLSRAAEAKINDMLDRQYFDHFAPGDRKSPWDFIREQKYAYAAAGENLAEDFVNAHDAEVAFMASPTHRANILNPLFTEVGVAVGQGTLHGRTTILIAQYFGKPRVVGTPTRAAIAAQTPASKPVSQKKPVVSTPLVTSTAFEQAVTTTPTSAVAGVSAPSEVAPLAPSFSVDWASLLRNPQVPIKTALGFMVAALCVAMALALMRNAPLSLETLLRSVAVVVALLYVLLSQDFNSTVARLTPTAASVYGALELFSR